MGPLMAAFIVLPRGQGSIAWFAVTALIGIVILARVGAWASAPPAVPCRGREADAAGLYRPRPSAGRSPSWWRWSSRKRLPGQPDQLLHVLLDQQVRGLGAERPAAPVHPVGGGGGGHLLRWAARRSHRPQVRHLFRSSACCPSPWRCPMEPVLDRAADRDRPSVGIGLSGDRGLRTGAGAGVGTISGIFFGFAFGAGAIGAALLGHLADATSIELVYTVCSFLPAIGLLTACPTSSRRGNRSAPWHRQPTRPAAATDTARAPRRSRSGVGCQPGDLPLQHAVHQRRDLVEATEDSRRSPPST